MGERVLISNRFSGMCIFKYEDDYIFAASKRDVGMKLTDGPLDSVLMAMHTLGDIGVNDVIQEYFSNEAEYHALYNRVKEVVMYKQNTRFKEVEQEMGIPEGSLLVILDNLRIYLEEDEYIIYAEDKEQSVKVKLTEMPKENMKAMVASLENAIKLDYLCAFTAVPLSVQKMIAHINDLIEAE